jgi:hypothetical protein
LLIEFGEHGEVWREWVGAQSREMRERSFLGSTGCQPVVAGIRHAENKKSESTAKPREVFRQAAEMNRLAACAPPNAGAAVSTLMTFLQRGYAISKKELVDCE